MTLDLVPLRLAAANGSVDGVPATALVAAGFTLLQRSAPLVRALAGKRAGILLPARAAAVTALAASDGRGAVLLDLGGTTVANIGAVFCLRRTPLVADVVRVHLDDVPAAAEVVVPGQAPVRVDLGSHFGLDLAGDIDVPGRDEEFVLYMDARQEPVVLTHRAFLERARELATDSSVPRIIRELVIPLLAGQWVEVRA